MLLKLVNSTVIAYNDINNTHNNDVCFYLKKDFFIDIACEDFI